MVVSIISLGQIHKPTETLPDTRNGLCSSLLPLCKKRSEQSAAGVGHPDSGSKARFKVPYIARCRTRCDHCEYWNSRHVSAPNFRQRHYLSHDVRLFFQNPRCCFMTSIVVLLLLHACRVAYLFSQGILLYFTVSSLFASVTIPPLSTTLHTSSSSVFCRRPPPARQRCCHHG